MRNKLQWAALTAFALTSAVVIQLTALIAQDAAGPRPPEPVPPTAAAMSCGQMVLRSFELQQAIDQFHAAGCSHIDLDYIADGYYLVRGTKILIGE